MKKTKIICTLGPSASTKEGLMDMIHSGMNVARINMSHTSQETFLQYICIENFLDYLHKNSYSKFLDNVRFLGGSDKKNLILGFEFMKASNNNC